MASGYSVARKASFLWISPLSHCILLRRLHGVEVLLVGLCTLKHGASLPHPTSCLLVPHDNDFDILAITETWFSDKDAAVKAECTPDGYKLYEVRGSGRNGGGTALIARSHIFVTQVAAPTWCSFGLLA